jgi:hypothetical protein
MLKVVHIIQSVVYTPPRERNHVHGHPTH